MKQWILISVLLHVSLGGVLSVLTRNVPRWAGEVQVYQVDLITMQPEVKAAEPEIETVSPESAPDALSKVHMESPNEEPRTEPVKRTERRAEPEAQKSDAASGPRLQVEGEPFPYNYYLETLRKRIEENWNPPFQEVDQQKKLSALVRFRIRRHSALFLTQAKCRPCRLSLKEDLSRCMLNLKAYGNETKISPTFPVTLSAFERPGTE